MDDRLTVCQATLRKTDVAIAMTEQSGTAEVREIGRIEQIIEARVTQRAQEWFPELGRTPSVKMSILSRRPSCTLLVARLGTGPAAPRVLAKTRSASPGPSRDATGADVRPTLGAGPLTPVEQTTTEFRGLQSIRTLFGGDDPAFGAIRPLDCLISEATVVMDYVDAATLRDRLVREARLRDRLLRRARLRHRSANADPREARPWHRAGQWLRTFQASQPLQPLPARQSTRDEVVDLFRAFHDYLTGQLGGRAVGELARNGAALAATVLPERLPLTVGHGDYAPRNMFVTADARLTVFDPLPRWTVPRYEDLCRFMVALRLLGLQIHTRGTAIDWRCIEAHERAALAGYLADDMTQLPQIRCYQLLILLDKWSALVAASRSGRTLGRRAQRLSLHLASGYIRSQGDRLLRLATAPTS
jgi:hypothetical protein